MTTPKHSERVALATHAAEAAFWQALAAAFPECTSGDFPPDESDHFGVAVDRAVRVWLRANLPVPDLSDLRPFREEGTGGGCTAWLLEMGDEGGGEVLVTWADDPSAPENPEVEWMTLGLYPHGYGELDESDYLEVEGRDGLRDYYRENVGYDPDENGPLPIMELLGLVAGHAYLAHLDRLTREQRGPGHG